MISNQLHNKENKKKKKEEKNICSYRVLIATQPSTKMKFTPQFKQILKQLMLLVNNHTWYTYWNWEVIPIDRGFIRIESQYQSYWYRFESNGNQ